MLLEIVAYTPFSRTQNHISVVKLLQISQNLSDQKMMNDIIFKLKRGDHLTFTEVLSALLCQDVDTVVNQFVR